MTENHREFVRIGRSLEFEFWTDTDPFQGRVEDLSEGGAFVDTMHPLEVDEEFKFKLSLDDEKAPISGKGVVKWRQPSVGMGIEFTGLETKERERIKFYVAAEFFRKFTDE